MSAAEAREGAAEEVGVKLMCLLLRRVAGVEASKLCPPLCGSAVMTKHMLLLLLVMMLSATHLLLLLRVMAKQMLQLVTMGLGATAMAFVLPQPSVRPRHPSCLVPLSLSKINPPRAWTLTMSSAWQSNGSV